MKIGVLGTGGVGRTLATKLVSTGHEVRLGSRTRDNEKAVARVKSAGEMARGAEAYLLLWLRLWGALKTTDLNSAIAQ